MSIRLAVVGLDALHQDWITALRGAAASGLIAIVGAGHRTLAAAREVADPLGVPAFDDLRLLLNEAQPQVVVMDRPEKLAIDFPLLCLREGLGILSLGPPVNTLAEALAIEAIIEPRSAQIYVWPRLASTAAYDHCAQADEFIRPLRYISLQSYAANAALAKAREQTADAVRSMSVLAWDAFATLIELAGMPESVYASIRGTVASGESFVDITGSAALTLGFANEVTASVSLSDRLTSWRRNVLLVGHNGTLELTEQSYSFRDGAGLLVDEGQTEPGGGVARARAALEEFLEHFALPPSPHKGWQHRLSAIAATMEALVVSHRTGQAEAPGRFLALRR